MKSMTGYGYSEFHDDANHFILSLKSYNNRFLDINIYVPPFLNPVEPRIRNYLLSRVARGRVELSLKVEELEEDVKIRLDEKLLTSYLNIFNQIIEGSHLHERISLSHILRIDGILKTEKNHNIDKYWQTIEHQLDELFIQFDETRETEGRRTTENIMDVIRKTATHVKTIEAQIPGIELKIKDLVKKKFMEALGNELEESRMLAEIAVLMIKFDIREEVERMKSHLTSFEEIIAEGGAAGKKLDFLCQELNREINTIGSKSLFLDVNNAVITIKDYVETIREQLRNVE